MPKPRHAEGGAYQSRGKWYARVTVAPQKREGVLLPWARPEDEAPALERARALQGLVNRLREAGEDSWIEKVLEVGGKADAAKLAELAGYVDEIVAGKIVHATNEPVLVPLSFLEAPECPGVYFVLQGDRLKIGTAMNIRERIQTASTFAAYDLSLLAWLPGGAKEERELHRQFRHLRVKGEWFRFVGDLRKYVLSLRMRAVA